MPEELGSATDYIVLTEEPSLMRAHLVAGALEEADIPTFIDGDNLADEFALSQKLMGLLRVRVLVPRNRADEARSIFLAMSQPIPLIEDDDDDEGEAEAEKTARLTTRGALLAIVIAIVACGAVILLLKACNDAQDRRQSQNQTWPPEKPPRTPPQPPILHK